MQRLPLSQAKGRKKSAGSSAVATSTPPVREGWHSLEETRETYDIVTRGKNVQ
jgi:hypothetical protein